MGQRAEMPVIRSAIKTTLLALLVTGCGGSGPASDDLASDDTVVLTPIHDIQGSGRSSPLENRHVFIVAAVTGDFQDNDANSVNNLGGFYAQEEMADADVLTSDGVFVFDGNTPAVDVNVGDLVRVEGTVTEHFGETQILAMRVEVVGRGSIQPTDISLPAALVKNSDGTLISDFEQYEGMLVRFPQTLTINDLYNLGRYGEVLLSHGSRSFTYTNQNSPDVAGKNKAMRTAASLNIVLDDGRRSSNAAPIRFLTAGALPGYSIRAGDTISELTGNLRFSRGSASSGLESYRLMPSGEPVFESINLRPGAPAIGGSLRAASFNVLNYFPTIDTGPDICGPTNKANCRGANSTGELDRQFRKMTTALVQMDADIVGLIEIENNGGESLQKIVAGLNEILGAGTYAYVHTGIIGTDAITTGYIYKPASVSLQGPHALLDSGVDPRFLDSRNRWPLAQTFIQNSSGGGFTAVINHLKSKGSSCGGDPDLGDGQGNCNGTRTAAAIAMADWLGSDPTASGDPDFLIFGDLNAYVEEDPLTALKNAGFTNLMESTAGPESYSHAYRGQFGALDYALASPDLVPQVVETMEWHINADEPPVIDYNLEFDRDPSLFDAESPYRSSDHDPVIVGIDLSH